MKRNKCQNPQIKLINWVTLSLKQRYQIVTMVNSGFEVTLMTLDFLGGTSEVLDEIDSQVRLVKLASSPGKRIIQFSREIMRSKRGTIIIVPAASKVSFVAIVLGRICGLKVVCIEWGDIGGWKSHSILLRNSMRLSYIFANVVWYKEPFMFDLFPKSTKRKLFFLPNAVDRPESSEYRNDREIDFIWANRFMEGRRFPNWYVSGIERISQERQVQGVLIGLLPDEKITQNEALQQEQIRNAASDCLKVLDFENPLALFSEAKYFVHLANEIYGNNSLFEAMARGVVPIVNSSPGIELIIKNGINGIICEKDENAVYLALREAMEKTNDEWSSMSESARSTVQLFHNVSKWDQNFKIMIGLLQNDSRDYQEKPKEPVE
jgi:glycosyltransferase involved in cell wall biosynthesis